MRPATACLPAALLLIAACVKQDAAVQSGGAMSGPPPAVEQPVTAQPEQTGQPAETEEQQAAIGSDLVFDDGITFDLEFSQALRGADSVLVLQTPADVDLNEIPDDLDKWLSRIRENGGSVKAAELDPDGERSRSWLGALIDVILFFVGLAKDEYIYSAIDEFDAVLYYDKGTGAVKEIVFTACVVTPDRFELERVTLTWNR